MLYKSNYKKVIERLKDFYLGGGKGKICAKMCIPNPTLIKMKAEMQDGPVPYPDLNERALFWDQALSHYTDLDDDSIPCAYLSEADQGLVGGMLGGKVDFLLDTKIGWVSSMVHTFADELSEVFTYKIDEQNYWYQQICEEMHIFRNKAEGKFGISHWCNLDGLHLVTEMRGFTNTYLDVIDDPEACKFAVDFAYKLGVFLQNKFFDIVGLFEGGTCSNMAQWLPGKNISESVDIYHMASADMFEEWGREPLQRIINCFDGAVMHIHSNGHHLIPHISTVQKLRSILLLDDTWATPVYQEMDKLDPLRGEVSYNISIPYDVFADRLTRKELHPNVFYSVQDVPDLQEANLLMKDVVKYKV